MTVQIITFHLNCHEVVLRETVSKKLESTLVKKGMLFLFIRTSIKLVMDTCNTRSLNLVKTEF